MKFHFISGFVVLGAMASAGYGQTLPEQTTATGIAGGLAMKGAPAVLPAAKKAKALKKKADERYYGSPFAGSHDAEPYMAGAKSGKGVGMPASGGAQPGTSAAPEMPAAKPWTWRLKGLTFGNGRTIAAFQGPGGNIAWVRVGESLDGRSKVVKISKRGVTVLVDKQTMQLQPW